MKLQTFIKANDIFLVRFTSVQHPRWGSIVGLFSTRQIQKVSRKKSFFSGPATMRGGRGKGRATKNNKSFETFFYFCSQSKIVNFTITILRSRFFDFDGGYISKIINYTYTRFYDPVKLCCRVAKS